MALLTAPDRLEKPAVIINREHASGGLAQTDDISGWGPLDEQDIRRVIIGCICRAAIAEVTIEGLGLTWRNYGISGVYVHDEDIDPGAAIECIDAILAFQPVRIRAAKERVVAAATEQLIFAAIAE